jgi:hypothetical protein
VVTRRREHDTATGRTPSVRVAEGHWRPGLRCWSHADEATPAKRRCHPPSPSPDDITEPFAPGRYGDRLRVTIDDSPIRCQAARQALERPRDATSPVQGLVRQGPGSKVSPAAAARSRRAGWKRISSVDGPELLARPDLRQRVGRGGGRLASLRPATGRYLSASDKSPPCMRRHVRAETRIFHQRGIITGEFRSA